MRNVPRREAPVAGGRLGLDSRAASNRDTPRHDVKDRHGRVTVRGLSVRLLRLFVSLVVVGASLSAFPAAAEKRVALVVGNSTYLHVPTLANPANDAKLIAGTLSELGFTLIGGGPRLDLDKVSIDRAVQEFGRALQGADVGLFYYAGHGVQVRGANYLVPTNANPTREADVDFQMLDANLVLRQMEGAGTRLNLVILDACRNNPFGGRGLRATTSGLAQMQAPEGTLISFATQPGNVALDGSGANSPFTDALAQVMRKPGLDIFRTFNEVGLLVARATGGSQQPWVSLSPIKGEFYFVPGTPGANAKAAQQPAVPDAASLEITFWESIKNEKNPRLFEAYLKRYPNGAFADIARITLEETKLAALKSAVPASDEKTAIGDPGLLRELRDRLYELNFDPGPLDGPLGEPARQAIREFEASSKLAQTGVPTQGLLRRLREIGGLKPWGAIVYAKASQKWGMSWGHATRKEAVASARASCGDGGACTTEISFFGTECGAFVHSGTSWSMAARDDIRKAKEVALSDCRKRAKNCTIVATVCADGADRYSSGN
jgi:hypothetical protein